jgi:hypothetical protein
MPQVELTLPFRGLIQIQGYCAFVRSDSRTVAESAVIAIDLSFITFDDCSRLDEQRSPQNNVDRQRVTS